MIETWGEALAGLESELFVGRAHELERCARWLSSECAAVPILQITGRGGVGKSALLRALARLARSQGRDVICADGRDLPHNPEGLLLALAPDSPLDPIGALNRRRPLILLDTFEEISELSDFLRESVLPRLAVGVKLAIAGRYPVTDRWPADSPLRRLVQSLRLGAFSPSTCREYLERRGVHDRQTVEQIIRTTGGNPLGLALATDLALQRGDQDFSAVGEWRLVLRTLVERLLNDVRDPTVRELLQACAVVRHFDEAMLAAVAGREDVGPAFDQLCRLSIVQPSEHGLLLHDDVRRALADDLRWRDSAKELDLRLRALGYLAERARTAPEAERAWLVAERLYLAENTFVRSSLFVPDEPGRVQVEPASPADASDVIEIFRYWLQHTYAPEAGVTDFSDYPLEPILAWLEALMRDPGTRVRIARKPNGEPLGATVVLPLSQSSIGYVVESPIYGPVIQMAAAQGNLGTLPASNEGSSVFQFIGYAWTDEMPEATRAALLRDLFALFAKGGLFLAAISVPSMQRLLEAIGFQPMGDVDPPVWTDQGRGYLLDLRHVSADAWLEAVVRGRPLSGGLPPDQLELAVTEALQHWHDDAWLAQSPLLQTPAVMGGSIDPPSPETLRRVLRETLARLRGAASESDTLPYRALELAYLHRGIAARNGAERLHVSRATYFRLLKRGARNLATALAHEN